MTVPACLGEIATATPGWPGSGLLPLGNAIVGIDLADEKQAAVVTDHDSRVIARRRVTARAWELGGLLDWALARALAAGFGAVAGGCEPTGHPWRGAGAARPAGPAPPGGPGAAAWPPPLLRPGPHLR